jgi:hypothetical protein
MALLYKNVFVENGKFDFIVLRLNDEDLFVNIFENLSIVNGSISKL